MKFVSAALTFGLGASAAVIAPRQAGCCFQVNVSGGPGSGPLGQLGDGQNRVGPGYTAATYCLNAGGITDSSGRGCILTPPTTQFQCDAGASPTTGFTITSTGEIQYNGSGIFYECAVDANGVYNIYTTPGGTSCSPVTLTTAGGQCAAPPPVPVTTPAAPAPPPTVTIVTTATAPGTTVVSISTAPGTTLVSVSTAVTTAPGATVVSTVPGPIVTITAPPRTVISTATVTPVGTTCIPSSVYSSLAQTITRIATTTLISSFTATVTPPGATCIPSSVYSSLAQTVTKTATVTVVSTLTQPAQTVTVTGPGATVTVPGPSVTIPGPTVTGPGVTVTVPGPTITIPGPVVTGPGATVTVPGPTVTGPGATVAVSTITQAVTNTVTLPTAPSSSACPPNLSGNYEFPHLIVPVNSAAPSTAYGTSYFGQVSSTISTIFNFDIPASYSGHTCTLIFLLPQASELVTSSYTTSGTGAIHVTQLNGVATSGTTYANAPKIASDLGSFTISPGSSTAIATGACAAGQTLSYELSATGSYALNYFQDFNPAPIGLYIREC